MNIHLFPSRFPGLRQYIIYLALVLFVPTAALADLNAEQEAFLDAIRANRCFVDPQRTEILPNEQAWKLTTELEEERVLRRLRRPGRWDGIEYFMVNYTKCRFMIEREAAGVLWELAKNGCHFKPARVDILVADQVDNVPRHHALLLYLLNEGHLTRTDDSYSINSPHCVPEPRLVDINRQRIIELFEAFDCRTDNINWEEIEAWFVENDSSQSVFNAVMRELVDEDLLVDDPETFESVLVGAGNCK